MAQDEEKAKTAEESAVLATPSAPETDVVAEGLDNLQANALDGGEVSRQLEDLTGVVLSSAEVSTRSAEVAANISEEMRNVMLKVDDMSKRNVLHSRVMLIGLLSFLMIAVGTFFAISTRLQQNIRQLDALSLAVGKRVVELDATLAAFGDASHGLGDATEKIESMEEHQAKFESKVETKMDDMAKLFTKMPDQIAGQVNGQSEKSLDAKLQNLQKSIQAVEAKMQALASAKAPAAPPPPVQNNQAVIAEIQKLKKDLEAAIAANHAATKAAHEHDKAQEKAADKAAVAASRNPPLTLPAEGKSPETKAAEAKAAALKAAEAKIAEAKAAEAKAQAKAAADAKAAEEAKAAEAKAKADAKAAEARAKAIEAKAAAERAAAQQPPAIPPRAQPKEDRVVFPRPNTDN